MKLLSFHLRGKVAHFRRYYSNSSALSYSIPPRTTIVGIVAGLLGYERDSYYDVFSLDQCNIAVANCSPVKKLVQKMNLLKVENPNDFNGSKGYHSQTSTELILPQNIRTGMIDYQIWFHHQDSIIMERLEQIVQFSHVGYGSWGTSLALGAASHLGWLQYEGVMEGEKYDLPNTVEIDTVIPVKYITRLEMSERLEYEYRLVKEDLPLEFDRERRLTECGKGNTIINLCPFPIIANVTNHIKLSNGRAITWME